MVLGADSNHFVSTKSLFSFVIYPTFEGNSIVGSTSLTNSLNFVQFPNYGNLRPHLPSSFASEKFLCSS